MTRSPAASPPGLTGRLDGIRHRMAAAALRSGRSETSIRLVAVTKTVGVDRIREACGLGLADFGENYVQEAAGKISTLAGEGTCPTWHLIGHLQTNKVKIAMKSFAWIHSADRMSLLEEFARVCLRGGTVPQLLLQVNLEEDRARSTKSGFNPSSLSEALRFAAGAALPVRGLMTFPPYFEDGEKVRPFYSRLRALHDELSRNDWGGNVRLGELSMGMSNDFETAIEEGATMVRVGAALFGARMAKPSREGRDGHERGGSRETAASAGERSSGHPDSNRRSTAESA